MPAKRKSSRGTTRSPDDPVAELIPGICYTLEAMEGGEHRFLEVSPQVEDLLGFVPSEWIASPLCWRQQIHPDDADWVVAAIAEAEQTGELRAFEYRMVRRTGETLWFRDIARPLAPAAAGRIVYRGVLWDITSRKRAEAALSRSPHSGEDGRVASLTKLAGGIAHDFNNLLTAILGHAELLRMELPENGLARDNADQILSAGHRAAQLVNRLIQFSQRQQAAAGPLDLASWLRRSAAGLRKMIPERVSLQTRTPPGVALWISGDEAQLDLIAGNLVSNAVDAIAGTGNITVSVEPVEITPGEAAAAGGREGSHARLSVVDDGEGITPQVLPKIFDPFFSTRDAGGKNGLGLAILNAAVREHGGFVQVASTRGKGTRMDVLIPRLPEGPSPSLE